MSAYSETGGGDRPVLPVRQRPFGSAWPCKTPSKAKPYIPTALSHQGQGDSPATPAQLSVHPSASAGAGCRSHAAAGTPKGKFSCGAWDGASAGSPHLTALGNFPARVPCCLDVPRCWSPCPELAVLQPGVKCCLYNSS